MAVAISATSPAATFANTAGTGSLVSASFTPPAGAIMIAKVSSADAGQTHASVTSSGVTWTKRADVGSSGTSSRVSIWTATGTGAAITVTAAFATTGVPRSLSVNVWTGAALAATPNTVTFDGNTGANSAPSLNFTTTGTNSVVDFMVNDWTAVDGTSRVYRSSATERTYQFVSGQHTVYGAWQAAASAGVQTFGLTAPTGQKPSMAAIELLDSGAASPVIPEIHMAPRNYY